MVPTNQIHHGLVASTDLGRTHQAPVSRQLPALSLLPDVALLLAPSTCGLDKEGAGPAGAVHRCRVSLFTITGSMAELPLVLVTEDCAEAPLAWLKECARVVEAGPGTPEF